MNAKEIIAKNVAFMLHDGDTVNLGIGIPSLVAQYIPDDVSVFFHNENGSIGIYGRANPEDDYFDQELIDSSGTPSYFKPGGSIMGSLESFAFVRSGRLNVTVLGAMQVDQDGNLSNWSIPGKMLAGMGGAMDLVLGAQKVIIAMEHCSKNGSQKLLKKCTLPLTAERVCNTVVTELGIFDVTPQGFTLVALGPNTTLEEVQRKTQADLNIPISIGCMR